ncbi:MAG: hypothetical protein KAI75_07240, partial [Desulfobulbaceae bacterium]|nr:hypothetical protein [Desulfobulbaceae bacterium]
IEKSSSSLVSGLKQFALATVFAAGAGGLGLLIQNSLKSADAIGKTADKLGLTTSALQEYRFAASQASIEQATLDMALQRFTRRVAEAQRGTGELLPTLKQYNIALKDTTGRNRDAESILGDLADTISSVESEQEKLRISFKAFDSEGAALVNVLRDGSQGLNKMRQEARDLGIVLDESMIRNAEKAGSKLDVLQKIVGTNLTSAVIALSPHIVNLAEDIESLALRFSTTTTGKIRKEILDLKEEIEDLEKTAASKYTLISLVTAGILQPNQKKIDEEIVKRQAEIVDLQKQLNEARQKGAGGEGGTTVNDREAEFLNRLTEMLTKSTESAKTLKSINLEMFEALGIGADKLAKDEVAVLFERASKWKAAGADIAKINEFLYEQINELRDKWSEKGEEAAVRYLDSFQAHSRSLIDEYENVRNEAVAQLDAIGLKMDELNAKDIDVSIFLRDFASSGVAKILSQVRRLKNELAGVGLAPVIKESPESSTGDITAETTDGVTNITNINLNNEMSRSDVTNIIVEAERQDDRG